ncbi:MAG: hypothetical protein LUG60_02505 [Erysipelotrichaceae bacterium]|nr:hypothetical protein [Erysipelotrichaceae bacterium]
MKIKNIIQLIIICLILVGCNITKTTSDSLDTSMVLSSNRISSSYNGIDFTYLKPNDNYWNQYGVYDDDCTYYENKQNDTKVYILKNISESLLNDKTFDSGLNGKDIPKYLYDVIDDYADISIEQLELSGDVEYINHLKFYNCTSSSDINGEALYVVAGFFQSQYYIPEVYGIDAPSVFLIIYYDDELTDSVNKMLLELEESILYEEN